MAEEEGFEPPKAFRPQLISSQPDYRYHIPPTKLKLRMEQELNLHARERPDFRGQTFTI